MKYRNIILITIAFFCSAFGFAQRNDAHKVALTAYVADNCGVPQNSQAILENQLLKVATSNGFSGDLNQRFIITAHVNILSEDITATAPAKYVYTLSFDLFIGDGISGTLFASTSVEAKGAGNTKDKAYMQALRSLRANDRALRAFVEEGREKIIEYYTLNCESIIRQAQMLAANQEFDEAMWQLAAIPNVCEDCYNRACDTMVAIYQTSINQEGQALLAEARGIWAAGQDRDAAERACAVLAQINPQSSAYQGAQQLTNDIANRIKALDNREWNFMLQVQKDETSIRKAQINSATEIAVAWAKNQPRTIYNVYWW